MNSWKRKNGNGKLIWSNLNTDMKRVLIFIKILTQTILQYLK